MHPNCHSQPGPCHLLIDSCQSPLIGVKHALETEFPPVLVVLGQTFPRLRSPFPPGSTGNVG